MNRRTLFKGLATLPFLRHLDVSLSTEAEKPAWKMVLKEEGELTGDGRDFPTYDLYTLSDKRRPVRDALPVFTASRGGIRYIKYE